MKAIITKVIPATNTKPVRVKIQAEGVPHITVGRDAIETELINRGERVTEESIHQSAAKIICARYKWDGELASGGTPTCGVWCHCFIPQAPVLLDVGKASVVTPPKPEPWKVLAVSSNHGSFGHKGVVVGRSNGEALELTLQAYGSTTLPNVGDLLDTLPTSEVQPRKLPQLPWEIRDREFTPATAGDFLAICGKFAVEVSVARENEAIREAVDGGNASLADLERLFAREF